MPASRIDSNGRVISLTGAAHGAPVVDEKDVQDPKKLAELLGRSLAVGAAAASGRFNPTILYVEDVVLPSDGTQVRLQHNLKKRVRWSLDGFREPKTGGVTQPELWVRRVLNGPGTLARISGDYTVGTRFTAPAATRITGARFPWVGTGGTSTVRAVLWRDPVGAFPSLELARGVVTCTVSGIYHATFNVPANLSSATQSVGTDLTLGIYDGGSGYPKTGVDTVYTALLPIAFPGFVLKDLRLYGAGPVPPPPDPPAPVRPTSVATTELYWVEPSLALPPRLAEDETETDENTLVLRSWAAGIATFRLETDS